jgi:hypothetical protein
MYLKYGESAVYKVFIPMAIYNPPPRPFLSDANPLIALSVTGKVIF